MKYVLVFAFLALVGATLAFEEQETSENFQDEVENKVRNRRWLFQDKCKAHSDCGGSKCCYYSWFGNSCIRKRGLYEFCSTNPKCGCSCSCVEGLACRTMRNWPFRSKMCLKPLATPAPTEEPGSGDFE